MGSIMIKPLEQQIATLQELSPHVVTPDLSLTTACVTPVEADGWFASLGFRKGETVGAQVARILAAAGDRLPLHDMDCAALVDPFLDPSGARFEGIWANMVRRRAHFISRHGSPEIIIYPGQFAGRHQGNNLGLVAISHSRPNEWFLSVADVLCMLLTHPERLRSPEDGILLCGADRIRVKGGDAKVPGLYRRDGELHCMPFGEAEAFGQLVTPTGFSVTSISDTAFGTVHGTA